MKKGIPMMIAAAMLLAATMTQAATRQQTIRIDNVNEGKTFDGIGAVNGGGATSVLLKDYPDPWRSQIMDMVFKPMWGASVSTMLVEIPGDGNSTQGSMPSHSHHRGDFNARRGYTWWVLREAADRNPSITLDATAWSAPRWVGDFWSQDMADYYVGWLKGLRYEHGLEMDAIGCHNEKGWSADFAKTLRSAMNRNGFSNVRLHGFDNWGDGKMEFVPVMKEDAELAAAIDIISAHTFSEIHLTPESRALAESFGKPIWNSEEHIYLPGFDCLITIVKCFNENYIISGATKIVNWYDIAGVYPLEPYGIEPSMLIASEPWSGHYQVREALWAYAHYGQFTRLGWQYVDSGCLLLDGGGSMVTLRDPATDDYSIIVETKEAAAPQTLQLKLGKELKKNTLCCWYSNADEQFVRARDLKVKGGTLTLTLQPGTVYSFSTTSGQQKGSFDGIPEARPFPIPYQDDFDAYSEPSQWGFLPHYTADIIGCYELATRPDGKGQCLRQTVGEHTLSWAPEWHHYCILGDAEWEDYSVEADVWLTPGDEAGVMGRVCHVGTGYGVWAKGYYLKVDDRGHCSLMITRGKLDPKELIGDAEQQALILARTDIEVGGEYVLDEADVKGLSACSWHNLKLVFEGDAITGYVDGVPAVKANDSRYGKGMAGLIAPLQESSISTPYFDNLRITPLGRTKANTTPLPSVNPLY
ncbi:MAG: galactosylceramidase [Bacteroidales bacterium]|nr:galactosylceramidase [Bacteroidales bacterium]